MNPQPFSTSQWLVPFGAVEILLPAALLFAAWMALATRSSYLLKVWIAPLLIAAAITAATKIAFLGWGLGIAAINFAGISGHAIFSAAIYPVVAYLLSAPKDQLPSEPGPFKLTMSWQTIATIAGFLFAAIIAFSRIRVAVHSWSEVISGSLLGNAVAIYALWRLRGKPQRRAPAKLALLGLAGWFVVIPLMAAPSRTHHLVERMSTMMSDRDRPYDRWDMLRSWRHRSQQ